MSVKEVNPLHSRYIELTARFKACWTFQRFHDGLQKFFGRQDLEAEPFDFQSLYKRLRSASLAIGGSGRPAEVSRQLDEVAESLEAVIASLDSRDRMVSPSLLRLFFQRVQVYDERILIEMVHFYQEAQRDRSWDADRVDKVDFLVSRLAEAIAGPELSGDRPRLEKILLRLSENVGLARADPSKVDNRAKLINSVRVEMRDIDSLERLEDRGLVSHYRDLKHSLGRLYFEGRLLPLIVDTNAALSALVESLWRREEQSIFSEYDRIAGLERGGSVAGELLDAVHRLHRRVGSFRKQMSTGNMRLSELAEVRDALASIDQLMAQGAGEVAESGSSAAAAAAAPMGGELPGLLSADARQQLGPTLREILGALEGNESASDARQAASDPRLARYRVAPREVTAYRRLVSGARCDEDLEEFLLAAAALRHRLNKQVMEIHEAMSAAPGSVGPIIERSRALLRLADRYLKQFSHFLEGQLLSDRPAEAMGIQRCRMQLMRDLSGLWLEAQRLGDTRAET